MAEDVTKFQSRWLSDWVRPQKSAKLQAKIPVPQGLGWPLPLKRGYKIGRRKSDQEHKTRPSEKKQNGRWNSEQEHKWLTTSFSKQLLPQRKATFKLTFPERIQIGKLKWIEQNNRPSAWGLTDSSLPTNWGFSDQKWPRIIREQIKSISLTFWNTNWAFWAPFYQIYLVSSIKTHSCSFVLWWKYCSSIGLQNWVQDSKLF